MRIFEEMRKIQKEIRDGLVAKSEINIFISYSSRDKEYADRISSALQNWGHDIWIDRIEMEIGKPDSEIEDILKKNIKKADCLLVLLSKNSIKSRWVKIEYEEAIRRERIDSEIVVLPAIIDDCEIPEDLL